MTQDLIDWTVNHPEDCDKAIEPLHVIAKRLATQPVSRRDGGATVTDGYDAAIDAVQNAMDGSGRFGDSAKVAAMLENLQINRAEKIGETKGMYSTEFQTEYSDLMKDAFSNYSDNCNSWEMNTACSSATSELRSAMQLQPMVQAANQREAQAQASLCQMVACSSNGMMMPPNCQSMGYDARHDGHQRHAWCVQHDARNDGYERNERDVRHA